MVTGLAFSSGNTTAPFAALAGDAGDDVGAGVLAADGLAFAAGGGASAFPAGDGLGVGVAVLVLACALIVAAKLKRRAATINR